MFFFIVNFYFFAEMHQEISAICWCYHAPAKNAQFVAHFALNKLCHLLQKEGVAVNGSLVRGKTYKVKIS